MTPSVVITVLIVFLALYLGVKYYTKIIKNRVDSQITEVLNEIFNTDNINIEDLGVTNIHQKMVLLQVVINALGDTIHYFKNQYNVTDPNLAEICFNFAVKKCEELHIELDAENRHFITAVISAYIQVHNLPCSTK